MRNFPLKMDFNILTILLFLISASIQISNNTYIFAPIAPYINPINLFDGPPSVSQASSSTKTIQPDPLLIQYYNYFSASVYCTDTIKNLSCFYCQYFNSSVTYFKILNDKTVATMALLSVHSDRKEIVVTFRGTTNLPNVLADFTFVEVPSEPGVKLHKGFYIATLSLYYKIVSELAQQLATNVGYSVVITGHSLGGAMASLTHFFLASMNQFPGVSYSLFTYGQARTGNKVFADYINNQGIPMARVVSRADIIPHTVPVSVLNVPVFGDYYYHHQNEYWDVSTLNASLARYCNTSLYEDPNCSNSLGPIYTLVDHFMYLGINYLTCIVSNAYTFAQIPVIFDPTNYPLPPLPTNYFINTYFPPFDEVFG